jgi:uncharacterized membrane protein
MERREPFFEAVLRPYRSLNAFGFRLLMAVLIVANGAFGVVMLVQGAWPVTGFMGLDVLAVYIAFRLSYAQACAFERIRIADNFFVVSQVDARGRVREWKCPSYWAYVSFDEEADIRGILTIRSHGQQVEIGRFLHPEARAGLARQLRDALLQSRNHTAAL